MIRFDLPNGESIEIAEAKAPQQAIALALKDPAMDRAIAEVARMTGFSRYETWQDMGDDTARDIAQAFFSGGRDAAEDRIADMVGDSNTAEEHFYNHTLNEEATQKLLDAVTSAIAFEFGIDGEEASDIARDALKEAICEKMDEVDTSRPSDVVPSHARVECFRVFGADENTSIEDESPLAFSGRMCGPATVEPNERLAALFEGANLAVDDYVAFVKEKHAVDLRAGARDRKLVEWLASGELRSDSEYARAAARERATAWKRFKPRHDAARPALLSPQSMYAVLEEASYGGLPCFVCRMPVRAMLEHDWNQPLLMKPPKGSDRGGFVGVYDPFNGSGYIELVSQPVPLPPGHGGWEVSGRFGYAVDSVFGIVGRFYHADPGPDPARPRIEAAPEADQEDAPSPRM